MRSFPALLFFLPLAAQSPQTILVLPFANQGSAANLNWVGESLAEEVREGLSGLGFLVVDRDARSRVLSQLGLRTYAPFTLGSALESAMNADSGTVVFGEFSVTEAAPSRLSVKVRVVDVRSMRRGAEFETSGPLDELWRTQGQVLWRVAKSLNAMNLPPEPDFLAARPPIRLDALESYVRALIAPTVEQQARLFGQAIRMEPDYSLAHFRRGKLSFERKDYRGAVLSLEKVKPADLHFREAAFFLGLSRFELGEYAEAEKAFSQIAEAVPLAEVLNNLGAAQFQGNRPDALENFKKAIEADPADPDYHFNSGYALWKQGRFSEAAIYFKEVLARDPDDPEATRMLTRCEKRSGPRPGDLSTEGLVLLKSRYNESAWLQLKAIIQK